MDASGVELKPLDISKDSVASMAETIKGADSLIIAAGFTPGANPLKWDAGFLAVDNVGTIALIDAAKAANVRKVVLVTSILTDAGAWGQLDSPGYQGTNVLGHCLEQKLVAEKYLKKSGVSPSHTILLYNLISLGAANGSTHGSRAFESPAQSRSSTTPSSGRAGSRPILLPAASLSLVRTR